jgi:hypothetical protein
LTVLWRAGLRISEALALTESDLDPKTGSVLVRVGKGGKRRTVGMDDWGWQHLGRWTEHRIQLPIGPLFCILAGPTRGRGWSATAARVELRRLAAQAGVRRRFAPHQLRHAHAIEMAHEGIPLPIIQRQLGHAHLGITSVYLQGIDTREIVDTVHHRRSPVIPAAQACDRRRSASPACDGASRAGRRRDDRVNGDGTAVDALPIVSGRGSLRARVCCRRRCSFCLQAAARAAHGPLARRAAADRPTEAFVLELPCVVIARTSELGGGVSDARSPSVIIRAVQAVVGAARSHTRLPPCRRLFSGSDVRCRS